MKPEEAAAFASLLTFVVSGFNTSSRKIVRMLFITACRRANRGCVLLLQKHPRREHRLDVRDRREADLLAKPPSIEKLDVLAAKLRE